MPETGQPGGGSRGRSAVTQGGLMAGGSKGPFVRVLHTGDAAGTVSKIVRCPVGVRWNVLHVRMYLDTDATVADRIAYCNVVDENDIIIACLLASGAHAANTEAEDEVGPSEYAACQLTYPFPLVDKMGLQLIYSLGKAGDLWHAHITVMEWKQ